MIRKGLDAVDGQEPGDFLGLLAAEAVDDARFAGVLLDELDELAADIDLVAYLIVEVGTVEGTFEHLCIHHIEVFLDVSLNLRCGCSREGYDGSDSELFDDAADVAVLRSEVVAPFGDTVCLVYGVKRYFDLFQQCDSVFLGQGFGRYIQQFGDSAQEIVLDFLDLTFAEG